MLFLPSSNHQATPLPALAPPNGHQRSNFSTTLFNSSGLNMNDGSGERNTKDEQNSRKRSRPEDFCRAVARVAIAQVCESVGFEGSKQTALDALSDIALRYICDLGKSAKDYANLAGRSDCNVFDVVKAMEDLASTRGFPGASWVDCCAADSGALKEFIDFVASATEIPFARPIPHLPISKGTKAINSFSQLGEEPSEKHIPEWLPVYPDPQTYLNSPNSNERQPDTEIDNAEQVRQPRKMESSLLRLRQRLLSGASAGPSGSANHAGGVEETGASEDNPFLAPPLPAGEKEVSQIAVPTRLVSSEGDTKHGGFVEILAPAISDAKERESVSMDMERRLPLERRSVVHFRLRADKKMLNENVDVGLRDEKKRRAEQILKQSMMNPKEMSRNLD